VCLSEQEIRVGRYLSHTFPTQNGLKKISYRNFLLTVFLEYTISKVQESQEGLKFNGLHQL